MSNQDGKYVRYSESVEVEQPNEAEYIKRCLVVFEKLQTNAFDKHRHAVRGAHAKCHGVVKGQLQVYDNPPEELRQGLFKTPKTYPLIIRYSTSLPGIVHDGVAAFRGMALKIIGVPGKKLLPGWEDAMTHDFIVANYPTLPTGAIKSYFYQSAFGEKAMKLPEEVLRIVTTIMRGGSAVLRTVGIKTIGGVAGQSLPETNFLGETFYSTGAQRYGDYVAKLSVAPLSDSLKALTGKGINTFNKNALRDLIVDYFRHHSAEYEFRVQLCTDLKRMPVEDASVEWPEDESPYRGVARITVPAQDVFSPERRVYADDVLSFTPWHCLPEHQPLGSIMRVRKSVYEASSVFRHRLNSVKRLEPTSIDELPD
jgi:hypothetical protein